MPPLIKRIEKIEKTNVGVRISKPLAEKLKAYSDYTNVAVPEIVSTAVEHAINSDAEFLKTFEKSPQLSRKETAARAAGN